ncbi:nibrin [Trichonephila clavipes]|nr:nibrin [Trichonephila clavipes]
MFSDESRFSLQSDSRRTKIWRAPGTRYHQVNTIERHRYGGAGRLVWGGIILGSRTDLHVQSVKMKGHIYWDVIVEQHIRMPSIGGYHPYRLASIVTEIESNRACVGYAWTTNCNPSTPYHWSTGTSEGIA